jgi:hypothetical protein
LQTGFRYNDSAAVRDARQRARDAYRQVCDDLANAWRNPDPDGQLGIATEGDQCTVRSGGSDEGAPGRLCRIGSALVCVPYDADNGNGNGNGNGWNNDRRSMRDATERAYAQYERELCDAWRHGK